MAARSRMIIDTDPGVDDVLAMLFAFSALSEDVEVVLLSLTFGNVEVKNCLRNVVSMFHVIEKEIRWREDHGRAQGFESLRKFKPLVAVGAEEPLADQIVMADYFQHTWKTLFERPPGETLLTASAVKHSSIDPTSDTSLFRPSTRLSHVEILQILEDNPVDTIDIVVIGPMTNIALAASESPTTFLRAKSVSVMGGAIAEPGNITPVGEFNILADPTAAARVFALTSPDPASTMPPTPPAPADSQPLRHFLPPYPPKERLGNRRLNLSLFPLDITERHKLRRDDFQKTIAPLVNDGSPLADWAQAFLGSTFRKMEALHHGHAGGDASLSLHDPLCVWYASTKAEQASDWQLKKAEDIRIETAGQWTRGMCVIDRRDRKMRDDEDGEGKVSSDTGGWLSRSKGNRIDRCVGTPGHDKLAMLILDAVFGN
ncbi:MAG: hypothetical protein Q9195_004147 [Heterodermia aff. obscurata]